MLDNSSNQNLRYIGAAYSCMRRLHCSSRQITMFLWWVRTPPMPGIGCPGKFYIRCPRNRKIGISGYLGISMFGELEVRKSENPDLGIPGIPDFRKSDFWNSGKPENQDCQRSRYSGFSENQDIQKSSKKRYHFRKHTTTLLLLLTGDIVTLLTACHDAFLPYRM